MKKLSNTGYKIVKSIHILSSSVWIGASLVGTFLLTVVLDKNNLREILSAIHYIDLLIIIPANCVTLITGIMFSKFTEWGFFKHRWIILKYVINIVPILFGGVLFAPSIIKMLSIVDKFAEAAALDSDFIMAKNIFTGSFVVMLLMLAGAVLLTNFKPKLIKNK
ncbi:MAG: DUF2269 family protein [Helicobacteraceae bacterium]|nr:DUF2269 family protein [Helicobacteraceae bacterium]